MAEKQRSVEYKVALLKYLIDTKTWLLDPQPENFWDYIGNTFTIKSVPQDSPELNGEELEALCKDEVDIWMAETDDGQKKRRQGHEAGSEYDSLMKQWVDVWDLMMVEYWRIEVERPGPNYRKFDIIPEIWRATVETLIDESHTRRTPESRSSPVSQNRARPQSESKARDIARPSEVCPTEDGFVYDIPTLQDVVNAAKRRAFRERKDDLGHAIQQIFEDSLLDVVLRRLLEKVLAFKASPTEHRKFQEYVKVAKRKRKEARIASQGARRQMNSQDGLSSEGRGVSESDHKAVGKSAARQGANTASQRRVGVATSSSTKEGKTEALVPAVTGHDATMPENRKRKRETGTSTGLKTPAAERVTKQAKTSERHSSAVSALKHRSTKTDKLKQAGPPEAEVASMASSPLSVTGGTDAEVAKKAYTSEVARRESSGLPTDEHKMLSDPASSGDKVKDSPKESGKSPAPSLLEPNIGAEDSQAIAGADEVSTGERFLHSAGESPRRPDSGIAQSADSPSKVRGDDATEPAENHAVNEDDADELGDDRAEAEIDGAEHANDGTEHANDGTGVEMERREPQDDGGELADDIEQLSAADSNHAYRIIHGAAAEAIAPVISRLEEKIDAMIRRQQSQTQQPTPPPQQSQSPGSSSQQMADASFATAAELMHLVTALKSSSINAQSPELVQLVANLAKSAAEACIHAAETAKGAAQMVKDVSLALTQIGAKTAAAGSSEE